MKLFLSLFYFSSWNGISLKTAHRVRAHKNFFYFISDSFRSPEGIFASSNNSFFSLLLCRYHYECSEREEWLFGVIFSRIKFFSVNWFHIIFFKLDWICIMNFLRLDFNWKKNLKCYFALEMLENCISHKTKLEKEKELNCSFVEELSKSEKERCQARIRRRKEQIVATKFYIFKLHCTMLFGRL